MRSRIVSTVVLATLATGCLDRLGAPLPALDKSVLIAEENLHAGLQDWDARLDDKTDAPTAGFVVPFSAQSGDTLHVYVTSSGSHVKIQILRLGWYSGMGARLLAERMEKSVAPQPPCSAPSPGPSVCPWTETDRLMIDPSWVPGVYLAKFIDANGGGGSFPFIVRSPGPVKFQVILPFATYQAYNNWGGTSLYVGPGQTIGEQRANRAVKVSFARPFNVPQMNHNFFGTDYLLIRWLEKNAYDVGYLSDYDFHLGRAIDWTSSAWLFSGHSEYWSWPMWTRAVAGREAGISLGFLGGNDIYWVMRYEEATLVNATAPVVVCYRDAATDPEGSVPGLATVPFRASPNNTPENSLVGTMSAPPNEIVSGGSADLVVNAKSTDPLLAGTGLDSGMHISKAAGWEGDRIVDNGASPQGIRVYFEVPYRPTADSMTNAVFQSTLYRWPSSRALVYSAGQPGFAWTLSTYGPYLERPGIGRFLSNLLMAFERSGSGQTP